MFPRLNLSLLTPGNLSRRFRAQDFTEPVDYTITAEDFKTNTYQIVVEVEE